MNNKLKRGLWKALLVVVVLMVSWPSLHHWLLKKRIKQSISKWSEVAPMFSIDRAVGPLDSPRLTLRALWDLAIADSSTDREREVAASVLSMVASKRWSLSSGEHFTDQEWDQAFEQLIRQKENEPSKSNALESNLLNELKKAFQQ